MSDDYDEIEKIYDSQHADFMPIDGRGKCRASRRAVMALRSGGGYRASAFKRWGQRTGSPITLPKLKCLESDR